MLEQIGNAELPQGEFPHPQFEVLNAELREKCDEVAQRVAAIKSKYESVIKGGSSFFDVSNNLLSNCKNYYRFFKEDQSHEDYETALKNVTYLSKYLTVLDLLEKQYPDIFMKELTERSGATEDLRAAADKAGENGLTTQPILYYIDSLSAKFSPSADRLVDESKMVQ